MAFRFPEQPVGGLGEGQDGRPRPEDDRKQNADVQAGDAVQQRLVDAEIDEDEGDAGARHDTAEPDARSGEQPDFPASAQRHAARQELVLQRGQREAEQERAGERQPAAEAAAGAVGMAEEIGQRAEHESHEQVERGGFVPRKDLGEHAAADEDAQARRQEKRAEPEQVAAEIPERMRQGGGQRPVEAEQDQQGAAAQSRQQACQPDEKTVERLETPGHGGIRPRRRRAGRG